MPSISSIFFCLFATIFAAGLIWLKVNSAKIKGKVGEFEVSSILAALSKNEYRVFNNITLPSKYGSTQIDHVVISIYGIFVIETKNYKGLIYGGENAEKWTKNMWGNKYEFRNPLKQNYGHVKTLQQLLNLPMNSFVPIVVFSGSARILVQTDKAVINAFNLRGAIARHKTKMFTHEQVECFCNKIIRTLIEYNKMSSQHIENVRSNIYNRQRTINNGICPQCGGRLILRSGRYGMFYGCSNYPNCRFTLKK